MTEIDIINSHTIINDKGLDLALALRNAQVELGSIAHVAEKNLAEDGEFAKLHASNVKKWVDEVNSRIEKALNKAVS